MCKKTPDQYELMKDPDIMWFCVACRENIEKALDIDRKIEEKCREISDLYESRIRKLEDEMKEKVEKDEVRMIARTVCEEVIREKNEEVEVREMAKQVFQEEVKDNNEIKQLAKQVVTNSITETKTELITETTSERNEQKARESNFVVHGLEEPKMGSKEERAIAEKQVIREMAALCDVKIKAEDIGKIHKLGTYDKDEKRPVLVCLNDLETKKELFRNFNKLWKRANNENIEDADKEKYIKYKDTSISHDMTKTQRDELKQLRSEAKALQEQSQGNYRFRGRGPPWAMKVVKIPIK